MQTLQSRNHVFVILSLSMLTGIILLSSCASKQAEGVDKNAADSNPVLAQGSGTACSGVPSNTVSNIVSDAIAIDGNKYKLRINQSEQTLCQVLVNSNRRVMLAQVSQKGCLGCREIFEDLKPRYSTNTNIHFSLSFPDGNQGVNDPANKTAQEDMQTYFRFAKGEVYFGFDVNHDIFDDIGLGSVPVIIVMDRFQRGYIINEKEIIRLRSLGIVEADLVDRYLGAKIDGLVNASQ